MYGKNGLRKVMTPIEIQTKIKDLFGEQTLCDVFTESRKLNLNLIRMAISYHLRENGWKVIDIAKYLNRKHPAISHLLKVYQQEYDTNEVFRDLVNKIFG